MKRTNLRTLFGLAVAVGFAGLARAQNDAFTYQGKLVDDCCPATGLYDFIFKVYDSPIPGVSPDSQMGAFSTNAVPVTNGLFTARLDFGSAPFNGYRRWLQVEARTNQAADFTRLLPRTELTATPYAIFAHTAGTVRDGAVTRAKLADGAVTLPALGAANAPGNGQVLSYDGSGLRWAPPSSATGWSLTGNSGTTPGANFLGTLDGQPLELRVQNARALRLEPNSTSPNVIGGHAANRVEAGVAGAVIGGGGMNGRGNSVRAHFSTVGGGQGNEIRAGYDSTIGGGNANLIVEQADDSTIAGGIGNIIFTNCFGGAIGGGAWHRIRDESWYSTIAGGDANEIGTNSGFSAIGGGTGNGIANNADSSTIAGGTHNTIASFAEGGVVGGGQANAIGIEANYSGIGGGDHNAISDFARYSAIGGGQRNVIAEGATHSAIAGGINNVAGPFSIFATLSGGSSNHIDMHSAYCTVGGGDHNLTASNASATTISGGEANVVGGRAATVSGGARNYASGRAAVVGGGGAEHPVTGEWYPNGAFGDWSTVSGGASNTAYGEAVYGTIGGGFHNRSSGVGGTISGGRGNRIDPGSQYGAIGGGQRNTIAFPPGEVITNFLGAVIGGGLDNLVSGPYSTIPGGLNNEAMGRASFAAGENAKARHPGAFVWADAYGGDFASSTWNEFAIRARGGVRLSDDTPAISFGNQTRQMLNLWGQQYGIGVQEFATYFRTAGNYHWYQEGVHHDAHGNPGAGGYRMMSLTGSGLWVNGTFVASSDRNAKTDIAPVNPRDMLVRLAGIPIATWRYTNSPSVRHVGPMAQDFRAAFGLGQDDKTIATVDADGVALAAIQGLHQMVREKDGALSAQQKKLEALEDRVAALEKMLTTLTAKN